MTTREPATTTATPDPRDWSLAPCVVLVIGVTVARLAYLRWICPYNLVEDEAHYWLWSQFPDWSYYSKGPGVAWAIWLSTRIFGSAEWAVRLPTALMMGLGTLAVAALARDLAGKAATVGATGGESGAVPMSTPRRVAFMAACAFVLAPALQMVGILMTIDGPYVSLWAAACWLFWRAIEKSSRWAWIGLGAALATGFLFKYTMLLLVPGLVLYAILRRGQLRPAAGWWAWLAVGTIIAALGLVPVGIWNSTRGWPTVRHLLGHLGLKGGDMPSAQHMIGYTNAGEHWSPFWSLELTGQQIAMIGPALPLAVIGGWIAARRVRASRRVGAGSMEDPRWSGQLFLLCAAAPILVFYLIVSLITEPEGNWPMAAYATLLPLAGWLAADAYRDMHEAEARGEPRPRRTRWMRGLWRATLGYGVVGATMLHFAGVWAAGVNAVSSTPPVRAAIHAVLGRDVRPLVIGRLFGAREMAAEVDGLLVGLAQPGKPAPFILTQHYGRASQMAYYLRDRAYPQGVDVLCAMAITGGRQSQFDMWEHTRLDRPDLIGRSAVILSNNKQETLAVWNRLFERVEPIPGDSAQLAGEHKPDRVAFIGRGYLGLGVSDKGKGGASGQDGAAPGEAGQTRDGR